MGLNLFNSFGVLSALGAVTVPSPSPVPLASHSPSTRSKTIQSAYTEPLARLLTRWLNTSPTPGHGPGAWMGMPEPIALRAFETPGNDTYLGVAQYQEIHAPIAQVAAVIDDYPHYPDLFDDLIRAEVRSNENGALVLFTEQRIPAPFVPNEENEMMYRIESVQANPSRAASKSYLYQLRSSKNLKFNDGLILLTQAGENLTIYSEIDFWDAEWGFIKSFGAKRIWASSLRALAQADLAIKLKAEHPEWNRGRVKKESEKQAQQIAVDPIYRGRLPVSAIFPETLSSPYPSASPSISPSSAHSP